MDRRRLDDTGKEEMEGKATSIYSRSQPYY